MPKNGSDIRAVFRSRFKFCSLFVLIKSFAGRHFRENTRSYNSVPSMEAFGSNWVSRGPGRSSFNPTITLHGQIYHYLSALSPPLSLTPTHLSVHILDTEFCFTNRLQNKSNASSSTRAVTVDDCSLARSEPVGPVFCFSSRIGSM